jgi:hypothetical protein
VVEAQRLDGQVGHAGEIADRYQDAHDVGPTSSVMASWP